MIKNLVYGILFLHFVGSLGVYSSLILSSEFNWKTVFQSIKSVNEYDTNFVIDTLVIESYREDKHYYEHGHSNSYYIDGYMYRSKIDKKFTGEIYDEDYRDVFFKIQIANEEYDAIKVQLNILTNRIYLEDVSKNYLIFEAYMTLYLLLFPIILVLLLLFKFFIYE